MELEQPPQEPCREAEVLSSVRKRVGARLGFGQPRLQIGDVLTQRQEARARRRFADEIRDQQAE